MEYGIIKIEDKQQDKIWIFTGETARETQYIQDFIIGREKEAKKKNSIFYKIKSFFNF